MEKQKCEFCSGGEKKEYGTTGEKIELTYTEWTKEFLVYVAIADKTTEVRAFWEVEFKYCPYCGQKLDNKS